MRSLPTLAVNPSWIHTHIQKDSISPTSDDVEDLCSSYVGHEIVLQGYLGSRSDVTKTLSFAPLLSKDRNHSVQLVSNTKSEDARSAIAHSALKGLSPGIPVSVKGIVKQKIKPKEPQRQTDVRRSQDVEVAIHHVAALNSFHEHNLYQDASHIPPEKRHLQLRENKSLRDALWFRAQVAQACRKHLDEDGWLDVETPLLFKSTPEGAREFLVPTRNAGQAYALPQSPQQYKQILMASGIPKYYQFARCFRDEDLRADRQPEFTQLDMEMSFVTGSDVMRHTESLIKAVWTSALPSQKLSEGDAFPRMNYQDAMARFGSDKPDTRLGCEVWCTP